MSTNDAVETLLFLSFYTGSTKNQIYSITVIFIPIYYSHFYLCIMYSDNNRIPEL